MRLNFDKCNVCTGNQGGCQNCLDNPLKNNKGVTMGNLDQLFTEALGPAEERQLEEEYSYDRGYVITKSGIELTAQSQKDEALGIEKKKSDSSIDETIKAAFV